MRRMHGSWHVPLCICWLGKGNQQDCSRHPSTPQTQTQHPQPAVHDCTVCTHIQAVLDRLEQEDGEHERPGEECAQTLGVGSHVLRRGRGRRGRLCRVA